MSKKSKINIFNVMTEDELDNNLKNPDYSRREYQRLIAMKLIAFGISHTDVAKIIGVSYKTINRWARNCSYEGIDGLMPEFNGGRPSKLSNMQKLEFGNILFLSEGLSMMDARQILIDKFGVEYSLTQVTKITDKLGFNYSTSRPEFIESPKNKEEILINTLEESKITENDIIVNVDESRMKKEIRSPKGFKLKGDKKTTKNNKRNYIG